MMIRSFARLKFGDEGRKRKKKREEEQRKRRVLRHPRALHSARSSSSLQSENETLVGFVVVHGDSDSVGNFGILGQKCFIIISY